MIEKNKKYFSTQRYLRNKVVEVQVEVEKVREISQISDYKYDKYERILERILETLEKNYNCHG